MAYTTSASASNSDFSSGPYLSALAIFTASRSSGTATDVTVSCSLYVGFGASANGYSILGSGYSMSAKLTAPAASGSSTIKSSSSSWGYCNNSWAKFVSGYSAQGKTPFLNSYNSTKGAYNPFTFSATVKNWTSGSKYATIQITDGDGNTHNLTASLGCPTYYTNASVSMTTKSQTVNPGGTVTFQWSGSNGTNNKISKYTLYYNGTAYDCGTDTSKTLPVPPAKKVYNAYVKATATYTSPTSGTITITTNDYGTPTVTLTTTTQTLKPDQTLKIQWSGAAGTANPISAYQLYYNDEKIYEGSDTSFTINVPPVDLSYSVYVKALGQYGGKVGTSDSITITTEPYLWVGVGGAWKSVQSVYIIVNGVWKDVDPDDPLDLEIGTSWKGV